MIGERERIPIGSRTAIVQPISIREVYPSRMDSAERDRFVSAIAHNVLSVARTANHETVAAGIGWYRLARREARAIAREHGIPIRRAAGIISALSPRTEWNENLRRARIVAGTREPFGMEPHATRAANIANGSQPLRELGGNKTRSFYRNTVGDYRPVTIDIWVLRVAIGSRSAGTREYHALERIGVYGLIESAIQLAARQFSQTSGIPIEPAEFQALLWLAIREPVREG